MLSAGVYCSNEDYLSEQKIRESPSDRLFNNRLSDFENVARADCQNNVTGTGRADQFLFKCFKRRTVDGAVNLVSQIPGGNADGVFFAGGIDVRQENTIRTAQLLNKFME